MPGWNVDLFGQNGLNSNGVSRVTVDAPDALRAKQVAEGIYGGRANMGTRMVNKPSQSSSSSKRKSSSSSTSSSSVDLGDSMAAVGGICVIAAAWWALPWMLAGGAIYGGYKISKGITGESVHSLGKKSNEKAALTMALIVAASGAGGFIGGKAIKGEFNSPTPVVIEEVKEVEEVKPSTYVDQTGNTVVDNQDNFRLLPDGSKVWY